MATNISIHDINQNGSPVLLKNNSPMGHKKPKEETTIPTIDTTISIVFLIENKHLMNEKMKHSLTNEGKKRSVNMPRPNPSYLSLIELLYKDINNKTRAIISNEKNTISMILKTLYLTVTPQQCHSTYVHCVAMQSKTDMYHNNRHKEYPYDIPHRQ